MNISSLERDCWLSVPNPQFYTFDFWFNFIDRLYSEMMSCLRVVVQGFSRQKESHPSSASIGCYAEERERKDNMSVFVLWPVSLVSASVAWDICRHQTDAPGEGKKKEKKKKKGLPRVYHGRDALIQEEERVKRLLNLPMYTEELRQQLRSSHWFHDILFSEPSSQTDNGRKMESVMTRQRRNGLHGGRKKTLTSETCWAPLIGSEIL